MEETTIKELYLAALLKVDDVRKQYSNEIKLWMFDQDLARSLAATILPMAVYNALALKAELSVTVSASELAEVMNILDQIPNQLIGAERIAAQERIVSFIKQKTLAKTIHQVSTEGYSDDALKDLDRLRGLSAHQHQIFDFTNPEHLKTAKDAIYPKGGIKVVKSSFSLINTSFMMGGYTPGTVNMVVARPGLGKTTMMLDEGLAAILQGYKVFHVFMGDMSGFDAAVKYTACYTNQKVEDVVKNYDTAITPEIREKIFSNLRVSSHAAYELNADKLTALCQTMHKEFPYDVVILDYDGNIAPSTEDSMYAEGGYTYAAVDRIAKDMSLVVLIGCQAKVSHWFREILDMEAAAESSKKQHAVDCMITMGQENIHTQIGTMSIAKMRRGRSNVHIRIYFDCGRAKIKELSESEYKRILEQEKDKDGGGKKK